MRKGLLIVFTLCASLSTLFSQVTGVSVETFYEDNGSISGYPAGHKTFRIYVNLTNATDRLTAVYGETDAPLHINVSGSGIWNNIEGGATARDNNCSEHTATPALEYDSFLAVGYACNDGAADAIYALDDPNVSTWVDESFDTSPYGSGNVIVNTHVGALWFGMTDNINTVAGDELKVLVAQITTDGEICGTLNFQVFPNYVGIGSEYIEQTGFTFSSAAGGGDIAITTEVVPPSCFGDENASIEVSATGGTGILTYSFDSINYGEISLFEDLGAGTYEVYVQDEAGCVAFTSVEIVNPLPIDATADISDITCHDENDGSIHINHSGGTGMLIFSIDGEDYIPSPEFDNLPAGVYNIHIMDMNNCSFHSETDIVLINPDEIVASIVADFISCHGANDGEILVTVSGGVAPYEFNYGEGYDIENPMTNILPGTYTVLVRDAVGCIFEIEEMAIIAEPTAIEVEGLSPIAISDGIPGGNTDYTVTGGIFPYTFQWTDEQGNIVSNAENLPQLFGQIAAGTYTLTITDDVGCVFTVEIDVTFTVNIDELGSAYSIDAYPNPTNGLFMLSIKVKEAANVSYNIKDASGRTVLASRLTTVGTELNEQLDISSLAQGVYFLHTSIGEFNRTIRLLKI